MKREIKFRAWDKHDNSMKRVISLEDEYLVVPLKRFPYTETILDYELMQYTGLKDKNGVEIYEGDVFKYHSNVFGENKTITMAASIPEIFRLLTNIATIEIIGNIYENPELL